MRSASLLLIVLIPAIASRAAQLDIAALQSDLIRIAQKSDGRVGACAGTPAATVCVHATGRFPMQSVMKLLVALAALDRIDAGMFKLSGIIDIHKEDLSLYVQPLADLVGPSGYRTTVGDLIRRAVIQSDSAATDILITRRAQSWSEYRNDPRDTATPEAMAAFLLHLAEGKLLSQSSTAFLLEAMNDCATFPDRLKAGVSPGWQISHKTGTSGSWKGRIAATNDVGILTAPDGTRISIAVFIADSSAPADARAGTMAEISAATIARYRWTGLIFPVTI